MQDLPPAADLLDAIAVLLAERVLPELEDAALAHEVRVAASLCTILAREVRLDTALDDAQRAALEDVVAAAGETADLEEALAARIAAGGEPTPELLAALRTLVRAKLDVARPGYDG